MKKFSKHTIRTTPCIVLVLCSFALLAQPDTRVSHFMHAQQMYNPAYTGSNSHWGFTMLARNEWPGTQNKPAHNSLCIEMPFKQQKIGAGLVLSSQQIGFFSYKTLFAQYAYAIKLPQNAFLRMGIAAGITIHSENFSNAVTYSPNDPVFKNQADKLTLPNISLGLYYHKQKTYLSLSLPTLLNNQNPPHNNTPGINSIIFSSGTQVNLCMGIDILPSCIAHYHTQNPFTAGINISILLAQRFSLGASYYTGSMFNPGLNAMAHIDTNFKIGYYYQSYKAQGITHINNGTHELMLTINFNYITTHFTSPKMF